MSEQILKTIIAENVTKNEEQIKEIVDFITNPRSAVDMETLTEYINYVTGMDYLDAAFVSATLLTRIK